MSAYKQFYTKTKWQNDPSTSTPLNEQNLNKMESGIETLDERTCAMSKNQQLMVTNIEQTNDGGLILYQFDGTVVKRKNTYLSEQISMALTASNQAVKSSESAESSALSAKESAEKAMTGTPQGYEKLVNTVSYLSSAVNDVEILGWSVPEGSPIRNEISGKQFIQRVGRIDLGSLTWTYTSYGRRTAQMSGIKLPSGQSEVSKIYCAQYTTVPYVSIIVKDKSITVEENGDITIRDTSLNDTAFRSAIEGLYLYYEMDKPIISNIDGEEKIEKINKEIIGLNYYPDAIEEVEYVDTNGDFLSAHGGVYVVTDTLIEGMIFVCKRQIGFSPVLCRKGVQVAKKIKRLGKESSLISAKNVYEILNSTEFVPATQEEVKVKVESVKESLLDTKMLGWSVPEKCKIKNEVNGNQFIQKVGRIRLKDLAFMSGSDNTYYARVSDGDVEYKWYECYIDGYTTVYATTENMDNGDCTYRALSTSTNRYIYIKDSRYETVELMIDAIGEKYLYYELLNPVTTTIDGIDGNKAIDRQSVDSIKMLGWSVPPECPVQNEVNGNQFIQKVGRIDLGEYAWGQYTYGKSDTWRVSYDKLPQNIKRPSNYITTANIYCSKYTATYVNYINDYEKDKYIVLHPGNLGIMITDKEYTDVTSFKTAMKGVYLYYELTTPITMNIDGNEAIQVLKDSIGTVTNMLNPSLQSVTKNGIMCTDNKDGTYTFSGTATESAYFVVKKFSYKANVKYRITGCPIADGSCYITPLGSGASDTGNGAFVQFTEDTKNDLNIGIRKGTTVNNLVFKPMICLNPNAQYSDFVPYTGSTGKLNSDVAEIRSDISDMVYKCDNQGYRDGNAKIGLYFNPTTKELTLFDENRNVLGHTVLQ